MASTRVVRVGVTEHAPWVERAGEDARGVEAELVRRFAAARGARIQWVWGQQEVLFAALEHFELDLVVGGLDAETPWSERVGLSREWHVQDPERVRPPASGKLVLGVPPGENRWLMELERFVAREQVALARLAQSVEEAAR